ncbi:MAG: PilZ domain-containing protein [Planctomycetes bacterium]|nr:PilZ domain-containing protein [Planctomycetota bacterium]
MADAIFERRRHKRHELPCPAALAVRDGERPARTRTINLSDGGMLLAVPAESAPPAGQRVKVRFSVPRSTPNTYLLEEFTSDATVVRTVPADQADRRRLALQFVQPIDLALDA